MEVGSKLEKLFINFFSSSISYIKYSIQYFSDTLCNEKVQKKKLLIKYDH